VKLRSVRCIENEVDEGEEKEEDGSSDEELIDFDINFSLPIMTLEQFITSLRINCLIFIIYLIFNFKEHGIETLFLFSIAVYNNTYIHTKLPKYENPLNDVQTLSDTRLFHASYSWLVQILLFLTSKENLNFVDKVLPRTHFIDSIFCLELAYFCCAVLSYHGNDELTLRRIL
jgi:hypothetical protein